MSSSTAGQTPTTSSSKFNTILDAALTEYKKTAGSDLLAHPLATEVNQCDSIDAISAILERQAREFKQFRDGDRRLMKWINPMVDVLSTFSETLGRVASMAFPPAGAVFTGIGVLLAVVSLEQGRALLWSEMRGLRTSTDHLRLGDAALAERFVAVCKDLEGITMSTEAPEDSERQHHMPDEFSREMEKVRELERKRAEIVSQIRALPMFENFLRAVPFDALQNAAACGPVVIINHCRYRCDILIVLLGTPPIHIPTATDFYSRTIKLKDLLLSTRTKHALESKCYQRALRSVLLELYELVGRPVIEKLHQLGIPEQSRVWWCPTSVLCSLPLHAAGPIESAGGSGKREIDVVQKLAPTPATTTTLLGPRATRASVMKHLPHHCIAHFACHATLAPDRPFDTAFLLHDPSTLSLLDIMRTARRHSTTAEFAMLSVCHAAEWTDPHTPDEALHLTAAMQYCGFRSAVGTLWAMADTDGPDLAEQFYRRVFATQERDVGLGERTARALRDGVRRMRKKGVSLERWERRRWPLRDVRVLSLQGGIGVVKMSLPPAVEASRKQKNGFDTPITVARLDTILFFSSFFVSWEDPRRVRRVVELAHQGQVVTGHHGTVRTLGLDFASYGRRLIDVATHGKVIYPST
ncbi:CHAT domain-containing protein [Lactarius quietus]|nr:CHAT domain-containing protein [Lactarius quietus]